MEKEKITEKINAIFQKDGKASLLTRIAAAISYLGVFCLAPIIFKAKNEYIRFHARQGLVLFICEIIFVLIWIIPFIGWLIGFIGWVACFIFSLLGLIRSLSGKKWEIPIIKNFASKVKI